MQDLTQHCLNFFGTTDSHRKPDIKPSDISKVLFVFQKQSWIHAHEDPADPRWTIHPGPVQQTIQQHRRHDQLLHHQPAAHQGGGARQFEDATVRAAAVGGRGSCCGVWGRMMIGLDMIVICTNSLPQPPICQTVKQHLQE